MPQELCLGFSGPVVVVVTVGVVLSSLLTVTLEKPPGRHGRVQWGGEGKRERGRVLYPCCDQNKHFRSGGRPAKSQEVPGRDGTAGSHCASHTHTHTHIPTNRCLSGLLHCTHSEQALYLTSSHWCISNCICWPKGYKGFDCGWDEGEFMKWFL